MEKPTKIGVWGFGVSGKAIVRYLIKHHPLSTITIIDKQIKSTDQQLYQGNNVILIEENLLNAAIFLEKNECIIPSPGIDLRPHKHYAHKFMSEIDLFHKIWQKPIIGITGTLGKTSITHILSTLLPKVGLSLATGGNIGTGMLDLVDIDAHYALLELSSFQLEHARTFVADIAVITNIYPNHLDRHDSIAAYIQAKCALFMRQNHDQITILPLSLALNLRKQGIGKTKPYLLFSETRPDEATYTQLLPDDVIYYYQDREIYRSKAQQTTLLTRTIPLFSYKENWLIIAAVLDTLAIDVATALALTHKLSLPEYRLEKVATVNGTTFYNDSKSTIMQATIAACKSLSRPVVIIGGISKGVDRTQFISEMKNYCASIVCFGAESELLLKACKKNGIITCIASSLEEAVNKAFNCAKEHHCDVLLSPGGASFDLFKDYKERGERFKNLVLSLYETHKSLS